jgi:hypothetical protein
MVEQWSRSSILFLRKEKKKEYTLYAANTCTFCPTVPLTHSIMNNKLTFGKYEGKTFEWLFFNKPSYAQYIHDNRIHRQGHAFDEEEGDYFAELYRRATHLGGVCCQCKERPVMRMGLATTFKHGDVCGVGFFCEECEYQGGSRTGYYAPSFIVEAYTISPADQRMVLNEIRRHYMDDTGNLTQAKMEAFFSHDGNFSHCLPHFFGVTK